MDIEDFAVGDAVRLKCGTVRFVVDKIDPGNAQGAITCIWLDDANMLHSADFHAAQLINLERK